MFRSTVAFYAMLLAGLLMVAYVPKIALYLSRDRPPIDALLAVRRVPDTRLRFDRRSAAARSLVRDECGVHDLRIVLLARPLPFDRGLRF